jgi:predicted phage terminase large subunit-like protein
VVAPVPEVQIHLPQRHPGQERIYQERERFNVAACGRRFGKTTMFLDLLIDDPGYGVLDGFPCAWFAGTAKIFDEVWRLGLETLHPIISRTDTQKHRIELVTGGILDFWSLDGGDRGGAGRGRKYKRIAGDEVALVPGFMDVWQKAIRPTLVDLRGDAWFASTPRGRQNDFYDLFQCGQPGEKRMKSWKSWQLPSHANPYLSRQELADMKAEYAGRPLDYAQEMLAEFVADFGEVFKLEWIKEAAPPVDRSIIHYQAWDLAVTGGDLRRGDWSVGVDIALDAVGRWWLLDLERGKWDSSELTERILNFQKKHRASQVWIEGGPIGRAVEPWLLRRMRETGQLMRYELISHTSRASDLAQPKDPTMRGLRKVANTTAVVAAMANGSFYVPKGAPWLPALKEELASFPQGKHDDQVDALSMAFLQAQAVLESPAAQPQVRSAEPMPELWDGDLGEPVKGSKSRARWTKPV